MSNFFVHRFICTFKNADISFPVGVMLKFSPAHLLFSYFHNLMSLFSHFCNFSHDFLDEDEAEDSEEEDELLFAIINGKRGEC